MKRVVWFRNDLRLVDNPALNEACKGGATIIPVYILDEGADWRSGGASRVWLHHSLVALRKSLKERGGDLLYLKGNPLKELLKIANQTGAREVFFNRCYEPQIVEEENRIKVALRSRGIDARSFGGNVLAEPWEIKNGSGHPYKVFTPFWRKAKEQYIQADRPLSIPRSMAFARGVSQKNKIDSLSLLSGKRWEGEMINRWQPGELGAKSLLQKVKGGFLKDYSKMRDYPSVAGTSKLSPHLHFGEISPRLILHKLGISKLSEAFIRQLAWREFSISLLFHFPKTHREPLNPLFDHFPWKGKKSHLHVWQQGKTGYPIVDAGMRELWHTGWMHNRVRMIVASFLVKDLSLHWNEGAKWFWNTLLDADLANNTMGWQWVAGCGADASPFFRVFNPTTQGKKFDPKGHYIKEWVPELSELPAKGIHEPWTLSRSELSDYGVKLGRNYPRPIIDHGQARIRALDSYRGLRSRLP